MINLIFGLFSILLGYILGFKRKGFNLIAGSKNVKTKKDKSKVMVYTSIYLIFTGIMIIIFAILELSGVNKIYNFDIWDFFYYIYMTITIVFVIFVNIKLRNKGGKKV